MSKVMKKSKFSTKDTTKIVKLVAPTKKDNPKSKPIKNLKSKDNKKDVKNKTTPNIKTYFDKIEKEVPENSLSIASQELQIPASTPDTRRITSIYKSEIGFLEMTSDLTARTFTIQQLDSEIKGPNELQSEIIFIYAIIT